MHRGRGGSRTSLHWINRCNDRGLLTPGTVRLLMENVVLGVRYRGASWSSSPYKPNHLMAFNISDWRNGRAVFSGVSSIPTTKDDYALRYSYSSTRLYEITGLCTHCSVASLVLMPFRCRGSRLRLSALVNLPLLQRSGIITPASEDT